MTIYILAVCGAGQGSSMILKMKVRDHLIKKGIDVKVDSCAISDYKSKLRENDIIIANKNVAKEIKVPDGKIVLGVQNMLVPTTFDDELMHAIELIKSQ